MTEYHKYLKHWTSERGITSFLGSDKPAFQRDWKDEKSATVIFGEEMGREDINRAGEPFKKATKLYRIQFKGNKGALKEVSYFVEDAKEGLDLKDRKVYDTGLDTSRYIYAFDPLDPKLPTGKQVEYGGFLGTLEQNKTLFDLVKSGKTFLDLFNDEKATEKNKQKIRMTKLREERKKAGLSASGKTKK
jgi:hypothetical protein